MEEHLDLAKVFGKLKVKMNVTQNVLFFAFFLKSPFAAHFSTLAQFVRAPHIEPTWLHGPGHGGGV